MITDKITIKNVKSVKELDVDFKFSDSGIIIITGKNGAGKTTIIKSFNLSNDPALFTKLSGEDAISKASHVSLSLSGFKPFSFFYNEKLDALDSKDELPDINSIIAELPIPYGRRFEHFSKIAAFDSEIKFNIASSNYQDATELIEFLSHIYSSSKFSNLKSTKIKNNTFYFILKENDYYLREDHFSSGEYFLIQLFRLITSNAKLVLIDELDVALDAVAQGNLYSAIKSILSRYEKRLIVISHSMAFMSTASDGELYYLEDNFGVMTLQPRSFGYVKSDLFGFKGFDRYILTEDAILEGFIEYVIKRFLLSVYYQHITIALNGDNQLKSILEKNDSNQIFTSSEKIRCIVDGDVFEKITNSYSGPTKIIPSPVVDIEAFIYSNRNTLLPDIEPPQGKQSEDIKKASKTYWKWLIKHKNINPNRLYGLVADNNPTKTTILMNEIKNFLDK